MEQLPLLTMIIFLPLLGAFTILLNGKGRRANARWVALWTSLVTFGLALTLWGRYNAELSDFQFQETSAWIPYLGFNYHVGLDGISLPFFLLTAFLVPLAILASWQSIQTRVAGYMIAFLMLETLVLGSFAALDFLLFYLFFESVLIPMFFIIGIWGGKNRTYAAFKFFLYTLLGSSLMLLGILYLYFEIGGSIPEALTTVFDPQVQIWLWLAFFASFAIKLPMWPFHTWLPDVHVEAPTGGSMLLAGILLKMGGYGFLRFSLPMFPEASAYFAPFVLTLSVIAILYTSFIALVQTDMKRLIAYSSVAHMGFVTLGLFTGEMLGISGAMTQMISHGVISAALFLCVGVAYERIHTREISHYGGLVHQMPRYAVVFFAFLLGSLGIPGTSGFVGEFLILAGTYAVNVYAAILASLGMILTAAYGLWLYQRVVWGPPVPCTANDLNPREILSCASLLLIVLLLGLYPAPLLKVMDRSVSGLFRSFQEETF